jgi:hypothetical protein
MTKTKMMTTIQALVAVFSFSLLAGCGGGATDLDVCNANCDNEKKCGRANDVQLANCHTGCNNYAGLHAQADQTLSMSCSNVPTLRSQELACLGNTDACNSIALATCQAGVQISNCLKR